MAGLIPFDRPAFCVRPANGECSDAKNYDAAAELATIDRGILFVVIETHPTDTRGQGW